MKGQLQTGLLVVAIGAVIAACGADGTRTATAPDSRGVVGSDGLGAAASCSPDAGAPVIASSAASPNVLWPPNHKFVPVAIATSATDDCDAAPRCTITSVSSNEPVNGLGDGDTAPDWKVTGAQTLLLRAERSGTGTGRVYTIGTTCTDATGNASTGWSTVTVPHDQGGGNDDK